MGNESLFIKVLPSGVRPTRIDGALHFTGRSAIRVEDFRKQLIHLPIKITPYKQRTEIEYLIVEDAVVVDSGEENSGLQEITLISCFSWYLESLHISFRLVELIHNYIVPVTVFHPANGEFVPISETDFFTHIRPVYDDKWEWFKNMYNGFHKRVLPFEFYDRWESRHPWWLRWFTH